MNMFHGDRYHVNSALHRVTQCDLYISQSSLNLGQDIQFSLSYR